MLFIDFNFLLKKLIISSLLSVASYIDFKSVLLYLLKYKLSKYIGIFLGITLLDK